MISKKVLRGINSSLLAVLSVFLMASASIAANYYIDANAGSDSNSGSETKPFKTISKVQSIVKAGDTVYFDSADTWTSSSGQGVLVPVGGVKYIGDSWGTGNRATIKAYSGIQHAGIYFKYDHPTEETAVQGFEVDLNNQPIDGIAIFHSGAERYDLVGATKRIENNYVHSNKGTWCYGIIVSPTYEGQDVANVEILNNTLDMIWDSAIAIYPYVGGGPTCTTKNIVLKGNDISNFSENTSHSGHGFLIKNNNSDVTIECNIVRTKPTDLGKSLAVEDYVDFDPENLTIRYNIFREKIYFQSTIGNVDTFEVNNNQLYSGGEPPPFDSYCSEYADTAPRPPANLRIM